MRRRDFLIQTSWLIASGTTYASIPANKLTELSSQPKLRLALVGTGIRGISMWGKNLVRHYGELVEFVGLCDINPGRVEFAKTYMGVSCPVFTDFEQNSCWRTE